MLQFTCFKFDAKNVCTCIASPYVTRHHHDICFITLCDTIVTIFASLQLVWLHDLWFLKFDLDVHVRNREKNKWRKLCWKKSHSKQDFFSGYFLRVAILKIENWLSNSEKSRISNFQSIFRRPHKVVRSKRTLRQTNKQDLEMVGSDEDNCIIFSEKSWPIMNRITNLAVTSLQIVYETIFKKKKSKQEMHLCVLENVLFLTILYSANAISMAWA